MKKLLVLLLVICSFNFLIAQDLPSRWDELTGSTWHKALEKADYTCILPIGILEKHGPHDPIGSDLIKVREWAARATKKEYAIVFPDYFYGQIFEAKQQPGTFSLSPHLIMELLNATCEEMGRNGFKKIIIINGHGGNPEFLNFFIQSQLEKRRDYAVYFFQPETSPEYVKQVQALRKSDSRQDMHAGESETSQLLYLRPELVLMDSARNESGSNQQRLNLKNLYTAIWWYADFPNHYAGEGDKGSKELGKLITENTINSLVNSIKAVKADAATLKLQNEYFDRVENLKKLQNEK